MEDIFYFYNGFEPPKEIDLNDLVLNHNYKGEVTNEFLEEHEEWKKENDRDYNANMFEYRIFRNPKIEEFQEANEYFRLDKNCYLDDFLE